jgi:DNA-binding protein HU-beta
MTKAELVDAVTKEVHDLTKAKAAVIVDAVLQAITSGLSRGEKIQAVGFGTFEVQQRAARKGRNPQKPSEEIDIPAKAVPVFRAGKALKDAVNVTPKKKK